MFHSPSVSNKNLSVLPRGPGKFSYPRNTRKTQNKHGKQREMKADRYSGPGRKNFLVGHSSIVAVGDKYHSPVAPRPHRGRMEVWIKIWVAAVVAGKLSYPRNPRKTRKNHRKRREMNANCFFGTYPGRRGVSLINIAFLNRRRR